MNTTTTRKRFAAAFFAAVVVTTALTGCQSQGRVDTAQDVLGPTLRQERPLAPRGVERGIPADRMAEIIERATALQRERAERFRGLPADRVEDVLEAEKND